MKSTVKVLGISLFIGSIDQALQILIAEENTNMNLCISATGAHGMVHAKRYVEFHNILNSFYLNLPDGVPSVWVGKLKGANSMKRCYGPDFFKHAMIELSRFKTHHFLCGGKVGVADKLKDVCEKKFGSIVTGTYCPPFLDVEDYDYSTIAELIGDSKADIVWIGLSTPKQEQFAYALSEYTKVKFICCVGAAFDFHIGNVKQAPPWLQKMGIEWFFRLLMEPKRLWKRYFDIVPYFIYYNFVDLFKGNFYKN